jgi:predicted outer membrane protein
LNKLFTQKLRVILLVLLGFVSSCQDQRKDEKKPTTVTTTSTDRSLFNQACLNNLFAIKLAEEAITRSSLRETKQVAETILREHATVNNNLAAFAGKRGLNQPLDMETGQLRDWQLVIREKGLSFDKKFLETIVDYNSKTDKLLKSISKSAVDAELKDIATSSLKAASLHQELAAEARLAIDERRTRDTLITTISNTQ